MQLSLRHTRASQGLSHLLMNSSRIPGAQRNAVYTAPCTRATSKLTSAHQASHFPVGRVEQNQQQPKRSVLVHVAAGASGPDSPYRSDARHDHAATATKTQALMQLARIHNLLPSFLLVMVGAWAGSGHSLAVLRAPVVWLMSLLSGSIAVSSCVFNDYFDVQVDMRNAPHKPLASGAVTPDAALLLSSALYCTVLIITCFMEPSQLRSIIALSAGATLLYTPVFKRLTAIKNATVALVIALAPLAGALAAGGGEAGLTRLLPATLFAFSGVMFREIVMDLTDEEGDREAGIHTLPVMIGKRGALLSALACVAAGSAAAVCAAAAAVAAAAGGPLPAAQLQGALAAPVAVVVLATARLFQLAIGIMRSGFDQGVMSNAIEECLKPVGLSLILLAALAP